MEAISVKKTIGVGDAVQFTSVPENYFKTTGKKLFDSTNHWVFDNNPFVVRETKEPITKTYEMWDFKPRENPRDFNSVYTSLAERHAHFVGAKVFLRHPRLYKHEYFPYEKRTKILLHTDGVSHGIMPEKVIKHILNKYKSCELLQVGLKECSPELNIPFIETKTLWDLAELISQAKMFIGPDSGPSWIAACYPDVIVKKVRTKPSAEVLQNWIPLQISNIHSHWDDRQIQAYNTSEEDIGFTMSYKKI